MEWYYLVILFILGLFAVADLIVGVSNDAVNFLGPAVGSRAGSFRVILFVAAIGIIVGAVFSGGMMEVARKGIFHPEQFMFSEILFIFLAVMMADVILLDFFNTFGLPTSTTVSLVFGLLGSSVAISLIKIVDIGGNISGIGNYINTEKVLAIISGILISVIVAFVAGIIIQYITRLIFSFDFHKKSNITSGLFGGFALTAILLFIVLKGFGDTSFITKADKIWVLNNTWLIALASFLILSAILQILHLLFKLNVFKLVVFVGTFGLALSFAGNDLVNFIGAPLAGLKSFELWQASGSAANTYNMGALKGDVPVDVFLLLIAGLIMVATIFISRKTRTVVKTTVELSRQEEGDERWGSSYLARTLVQGFFTFQNGVEKILPKKFLNFIALRFENTKQSNEENPAVSFDLIRASVNLVVASILIAFATSLRLPLSTTYVTFMVAMGTSLADGAWGRESAVYRVTGVITVISGWFFTAFIAFIVAGIIAVVIYLGGMYGVVLMLLLIGILLYKSKIKHKERVKQSAEIAEAKEYTPESSIELSEITNQQSMDVIKKISLIYSESIDALEDENRKSLKILSKDVNLLNKHTKKLKGRSLNIYKNLNKDLQISGSYIIQIYDYIREIEYCLNYITTPSFIHVNNIHNPIPSQQIKDLRKLKLQVNELFEFVIEQLTKENISFNEVQIKINNVVLFIENNRVGYLRDQKESDINTRSTMLYLGIMHETKNMLIHIENFSKAYENFLLSLPK
ncbi:MAG: inorganic phosphate transporter [Bacteroidia bacterium]|nr:inorganic phosphate transporter [Bacteroidia bacterium]